MADANHARIDLENLRQETTTTDRFAQAVTEEAERLRLELGAPPRVTVSEEPFIGGGLESNRRARDIFLRLSEADPGAPGPLPGLAAALNNLGVLQRQAGRHKEALRSYEQARDVGLRLCRAHPGVAASDAGGV